MKTAASKNTTKREYRAPRLVNLGDVKKLTQGKLHGSTQGGKGSNIRWPG